MLLATCAHALAATTSQTLINPGHPDQVRTREYDAANRLTASVDATQGRRTLAYDNTKNVIARSDARGHLTHDDYNARDELIKESGPAPGQQTTYTYDLAGNRLSETWSNGNVRTSSYDTLERHTATSDSLGPVESFTYTANDQVNTRTDANGHTTTNRYDGLHRLYQQDLPRIGTQARTLLKHYNVHGDVLTETDAGNHTTTHTYDALGRLSTTTLAAVDDPGQPLTFQYDLAGNRLSQSDARGNVTAFTYDDLNHRLTQVDPPTADAATQPGGHFSQIWTSDAAGNELTTRTWRRRRSTRTYRSPSCARSTRRRIRERS